MSSQVRDEIQRGSLVSGAASDRYPIGKDRKTLAAFSLIAGGSSIVLLVLLLLSPPGNSAQQLYYVSSHRALTTIFEFVVLLWATLSAPFAFGLGSWLQGQNRLVARAATGLSAFGVLLLGFATYANTGALLAINAAGTPPTAGADVYLANFWGQLGFLLTDPPLMAWGLGQMMFASLAWNGRVMPRWLVVIGGLGGLATILGSLDLPSQAIFLIAFGILAFAVWGIGTGVLMLRQPGEVTSRKSPPITESRSR